MNEINNLFKELEKNINVRILDFECNGVKGKIAFHIYLADLKLYNMYFKEKISNENKDNLDKVYPGVYYKFQLIKKEILTSIFNGNIFLMLDNENSVIPYIIICQQIIGRSISDSIYEPINQTGARDGFIESIETNLSLIQKRIKTECLITERLLIGSRGNSVLCVLYIKDIVKTSTVNKIIEKIENINIDCILSIKDISNEFEKNTLFPVTSEVGNPEIATDDLLDGRIIILIDQIPIALTIPVDITYFMTLKEGKHSNKVNSVHIKILSFIFLFLSCYFLGIYAAFVNYHRDSISLIALSEIKSSLRGSTLPLYLEFIFLIFIFDLLKLSSTKSPNITLQNVIVTVGGLLIGQNAVSSGFISSFNLVITAITYISGYAITNNQRFVNSINIIRLIVLFSGMLFGILGVIATIIIITSIIYSEKSISTSYLSPIIPFYKKTFFEYLFGKSIYKNKYRSKQNNVIDSIKGKNNL